jgi:chondroitin AC lyase
MVHRRPGWYASTKMLSVRTAGTESGNGEGLLQYHLADGANFILRDGDEIHGLQPVWEWRRIPGVTCRQGTGGLPLVPWGMGARGRTRFVGGVSDGRYGVAALDFDRAGVKARKAWFYFDDEVVCLGAGIRAGRGEASVATTIAQGRLASSVERGPGWVHHDETLYLLLDPPTVTVEAGPRRGTWRSVNERYSDEIVEAKVFALWIDHGPEPDGATYAYVVVPGASRDRVETYARAPAVRILENTPARQAVIHEATGRIGVVFYRPGTRDGVTVDRPCVVLLSAGAVSVADPAQTGKPIRVGIDGREVVVRPRGGRSTTFAR